MVTLGAWLVTLGAWLVTYVVVVGQVCDNLHLSVDSLTAINFNTLTHERAQDCAVLHSIHHTHVNHTHTHTHWGYPMYCSY